jgi:hypothetical protein
MHLIAPFISLAAWWNLRLVRRAAADFRRATFYATRAERALVASGRIPKHLTASGVPVMPKLPPYR